MQYVPKTKEVAMVKRQSSLAAEYRLLDVCFYTSVPTAELSLGFTKTDISKSNTKSKTSHRFPACSHFNRKELTFYRGNAILNNETGEIYAPHIKRKL